MSVSVKVPMVRPDLGEEEIAEVARVIRSGWIMQGPEVEAFEAELAAFLGTPAAHAVCVSSGTAALELALRVVGVGAGDEVVTVSHSFIATANAVVNVGARPVFVDVEEGTYGMDPAHLAAALGPRTRAVLAVHQLGMPCAIEAICALAAEAGVPVVEDAACAIGSEVAVGGAWQRVGRPLGSVACFSFHPRKVLTTGEGGLLTTRDAALAARARSLRQHALRPGEGGHPEQYLEPAWNLRMTDVQAALGRPQLRRLPAAITARRRLAARFHEALGQSSDLCPAVEPAWARSNWQSYPARVRHPRAGAQAEIRAQLAARGVATRGGLTCAHEEPAYAGTDRFRVAPGGLAVSERLRAETILLPLFHNMTDDEVAAVVAAVR